MLNPHTVKAHTTELNTGAVYIQGIAFWLPLQFLYHHKETPAQARRFEAGMTTFFQSRIWFNN